MLCGQDTASAVPKHLGKMWAFSSRGSDVPLLQFMKELNRDN
jgi:hypothetical protein